MLVKDIILTDLKTMTSKGHCLYYFEGNFFYPTEIHGADAGRIKRAIREFKRDNPNRVNADRNSPSYKTKLQLMDEQMAGFGG